MTVKQYLGPFRVAVRVAASSRWSLWWECRSRRWRQRAGARNRITWSVGTDSYAHVWRRRHRCHCGRAAANGD